MSGLIYPTTLPGLTWDSVRTPIFNTRLQESVSGKESRMAFMQYARFRFELQYELLRDYTTPSDLRALVGLFEQMRGRYDTFLYTDPTFSSVTDEQFGIGDGGSTQFQLTATFQNSGGPGWPSLIQNPNGAVVIKKAGVVQAQPAACSIGATGIVTFVTAPAAATALTWTGSFYHRCRFDSDEMSVTQFLSQFWRTKTVTFKSIKL